MLISSCVTPSLLRFESAGFSITATFGGGRGQANEKGRFGTQEERVLLVMV
jgi:hypothetical protein